MKKYLLLLCAIGGLYNLQAQQGFHLGVSGTFNSTWILNQNNYGTLAPFNNPIVRQSEMDYRKTWGGNAGIAAGYNFTRNWGLKMELQYNVTGQKYEDNFEGPATIPQGSFGSPAERVNVKRDIKLQYVQIPLMARFISNKAHIVKAFVCLGPQIGIRTMASEEVQVAGYLYVDTASNFMPKQKFKSVDVGLALQFGAQLYATDNLYFEIGASAYGGLNDLNGKIMRNLDWFSKNDVRYQKSYNFRIGLMAGVYYIFGRGREVY